MPPRFRRTLRALAAALVTAAVGAGAQELPAPVEFSADQAVAADAAIAQVRHAIDPASPPPVAARRTFEHFGRPSLEITGRVFAAQGDGEVREYAIFDLAAQRLVTFVYFPHASARRSGEAILSLGAIAAVADAAVHGLLPGRDLVLDGIQRFRASGLESVYYEAGYAPAGGEVPFLVPPVRLLLDASNGRVFRFEQDPEWPDSVRLPRALLSRSAAERIAAITLRRRDLDATFGPGAALGAVGPAELYVVRPNGWLGSDVGAEPGGARAAWVVPFRLAGEASGVGHQLFVDAAGGRVLGGVAGQGPPR